MVRAGWAVVGALALASVPIAQPRVPLARGEAGLLELLTPPTQGSFRCRRVAHLFPQSEELQDESARYAREVMRECRDARVDDGYVPAAARSLAGLGSEFRSEDWVAFRSDGWRMVAIAGDPAGDPSGRTQRLVARSSRDVLRELRQDGWRSPTYWDIPHSGVTDSEGTLRTFLGVQEQILLVTTHPEADVAPPSAGRSSWGWSLRLPPDWSWHQLGDALPPNGVIEIASEASVTWQPNASRLVLSWSDCKGLDLLRTSIAWQAGGTFPALIEETRYFAGGTRVKRAVRVEIEAVEPEILPAALHEPWKPGSFDQRVVDLRFGGRAGPIERVKTDADTSWAATLVSANQPTGTTAGSSLDASMEWAPALEALNATPAAARVMMGPFSVRPATFALGRHPAGAWVPVAFELTNASDESVVLGDPVLDCGCLSVELSHRELAPAQSALLRGRQEIQAIGAGSATIEVPVESSSGARHDVRLTIAYHGSPAIVTPARVVDLGLIDGRSNIARASFRVLDGGCVSAGSPAECRLSGDFDGTLDGHSLEGEPAGVIRLEGALRLQDPALFGVLRATARIESELCSTDAAAGTVTLVGNRAIPAVLDWPECVAIIRDGVPAVISFAGIGLRDIELPPELASAGIVAELTARGGIERLELRRAVEAAPIRDPLVSECLVESTHGLIRLLVYLEP